MADETTVPAFTPRMVVRNTETNTIWWLAPDVWDRGWPNDEDSVLGDSIVGHCIWSTGTTSKSDWKLHDECPFELNDDLEEIEILGYDYDREHATAIAALAGRAGFVKGDNND